MHDQRLLEVRIIGNVVPPFVPSDEKAHLNLPDIGGVNLADTVQNQLEVVYVIQTLYLRSTFFSGNQTVWATSNVLIELYESYLVHFYSSGEFIDFSGEWFEFVPSVGFLVGKVLFLPA